MFIFFYNHSVKNHERNFRISIILLFIIGIVFGVYEELNPYVFPSQIALYLDEIDYLPDTTLDNVHFVVIILLYICLYFFVPYSNYVLLAYIIIFYLIQIFISDDNTLAIYSPLFQNMLYFIYMLFGVQIYLMFFTSLSEKFNIKKK